MFGASSELDSVMEYWALSAKSRGRSHVIKIRNIQPAIYIQILYDFLFMPHSLSFSILQKRMTVRKQNKLYNVYTKMTAKCFQEPQKVGVSDTHVQNFGSVRTPTTPTVAAAMLGVKLDSKLKIKLYTNYF